MLKFLFFLLLVLCGTTTLAQQQFFLYIQSASSQPFYARIQNKIYSSSENGYMIVPKLHDSTYDVFVGFARNQVPEQHFAVTINKQDVGFELRNFGEKGWGLFNIQNTAVVMNSTPEVKIVADNTGEKKNDAFSQMLANVVNDSAILYTAAKPVAPPPVVKQAAATTPPPATNPADSAVVVTSNPVEKPVTVPTKDDTRQAAADSALAVNRQPLKKDSTVANPPANQVAVNTPPATTPAVTTPPKSEVRLTNDLKEKPFIARVLESKDEQGYKATYIEQYIYSTDTVNVEIPFRESAPAASVQTQAPAPVTIQQKVDTPAVVTGTTPTPVKTADTTSAAPPKKAGPVITNTDCKSFASDNDVDKLRVKLLAENAVDDKLAAAKKYFKNKCFSVKQIRALTELFPSDETRYRFFDLSYPFVSDPENFGSLEEMISNDYFKTRFKAMIRR